MSTSTRITMTKRQFRESGSLHPQLAKVVEYAAQVWPNDVPYMEITSIHRTKGENELAGAKTQMHVVGPPFRSVDLRVWNLGTLGHVMKDRMVDICMMINYKFSYDPSRPRLKVAFCRPHGTGPHIHLQVHPNTVSL